VFINDYKRGNYQFKRNQRQSINLGSILINSLYSRWRNATPLQPDPYFYIEEKATTQNVSWRLLDDISIRICEFLQVHIHDGVMTFAEKSSSTLCAAVSLDIYDKWRSMTSSCLPDKDQESTDFRTSDKAPQTACSEAICRYGAEGGFSGMPDMRPGLCCFMVKHAKATVEPYITQHLLRSKASPEILCTLTVTVNIDLLMIR
jgi:hypothetical protein